VVARPSIERLTGCSRPWRSWKRCAPALPRSECCDRAAPAGGGSRGIAGAELCGNPDRFHEVNERFHNAIYAGSQNGYIAEMTLATRVRVQPFRRAQFRNLGRLAKSNAEHDRVVVAIMRGDKAGAAAAMRAHIELVRGEYEIYAVSV